MSTIVNSDGLMAEELRTNLVPKEMVSHVGEKLVEKVSDSNENTAVAADSNVSSGLPLPSFDAYRMAILQDLINAVEFYNKESKKVLKNQPKKLQKKVKLALDVQLLAELTYESFSVGYGWRDKKVEEKIEVIK